MDLSDLDPLSELQELLFPLWDYELSPLIVASSVNI